MKEKKLPFRQKKSFQVRWNEPLGKEDCPPYLVRWVLIFFGFSIRLHHWRFSDDDRHFHDHAWWFVTLVLKGGYTDVSADGEDKLSAGSIRFRPALHAHTVKVDDGGAWTLMFTGKMVRHWGFWIGDRFQKSRNYFRRWGHHDYPCE